MSVLVDTSIWVRFLAGQGPHADELDRLLSLDEVIGHPLIFGELLIGDIGGRPRLLADYERMKQALAVPHEEVVAFVRARKLHGRGLGWIDASLMAACIVDRLLLWTADVRLDALANELGIGYQLPTV